VVAHLLSHAHGHRLRIKTALAEGEGLPTVTGLWPSAGFDEREAWEMFGIVFEGHPNLQRLLTTDDFEGYPLRKDFPLRGTVGGRIRTICGARSRWANVPHWRNSRRGRRSAGGAWRAQAI
jgi:NADH-quinone oxidoreductase subunit C